MGTFEHCLQMGRTTFAGPLLELETSDLTQQRYYDTQEVYGSSPHPVKFPFAFLIFV